MATASPKKTAQHAAKRLPPEGASHAPSAQDDGLPDKQAIACAFEGVRAFVRSPGHARVRSFLERLAQAPPQVLLLEGGDAGERLNAAHYWILLLNCDAGGRNAGGAPLPCLACPECVRMITHLHRDCFFYDGLAASIKIDDVRALLPVLGEPPREARRRVVIFREAQSLVEAAANALLKSFEEPRPGTSFIMLAPQRERLLPTLVSRSVTLTLPWPLEQDAATTRLLASWEEALCSFLRTGRGFFERSGAKGAMDAPLAHAITNMCRRALAACLGGRDSGMEGLQALLSRMPETRLRMLDEALAECQDSLVTGVHPALALEWLVTRMFFLVPRS